MLLFVISVQSATGSSNGTSLDAVNPADYMERLKVLRARVGLKSAEVRPSSQLAHLISDLHTVFSLFLAPASAAFPKSF